MCIIYDAKRHKEGLNVADKIDTPRAALWVGNGDALRANYDFLLAEQAKSRESRLILIATHKGAPGSKAWIITSEKEFNKYRNGANRVAIVIDYNRPH